MLSLSVLQNIPLAKAADMVLAGQGEEEPIGIILLQLLDYGLAQKNNTILLFSRESWTHDLSFYLQKIVLCLIPNPEAAETRKHYDQESESPVLWLVMFCVFVLLHHDMYI